MLWFLFRLVKVLGVVGILIFSWGIGGYGLDTIFVTILPQKWVVDRIVGDDFEVISVVDRGMNPHSFDITPSMMNKIASSKVYFTIGLGDSEENLVSTLRKSFPNLNIVDVSKGIDKVRFSHSHSRCFEHNHKHSSFDPHVWTSPLNMKIIAKNVFEEVSRIRPERESFYRERYLQLINELDDLHKEIKKMLEPFRGRRFMVFHSAFKYFEKEYGVIEVSIEYEGKEPTPKQIRCIIDEAKRNRVRVVFVQTGFSQKSARIIADEINGLVEEINQLDYNYIDNMKFIASKIRDSYSK